MQMKAFRLNKYENSGKVLKYSDPFKLYRVTVLVIGTLNCMVTTVWNLNSQFELHLTF